MVLIKVLSCVVIRFSSKIIKSSKKISRYLYSFLFVITILEITKKATRALYKALAAIFLDETFIIGKDLEIMLGPIIKDNKPKLKKFALNNTGII